MSKSSLLMLFMGATIVVVMAEVMVNDYEDPASLGKDLKASVVYVGTQADFSAKTMTSPPSTQQPPAEVETVSRINFEMLSEAGFTDTSIQPLPFRGILFGSVDLREYKTTPVIQLNLLRSNRSKIMTIVDFEAQDSKIAGYVYGLLKEKSLRVIGAGVNETGTYGDSSFFLNFESVPDNVFLVVKSGISVYALSYPKALHADFKKLLTLL